jgi:hypothetical protein
VRASEVQYSRVQADAKNILASIRGKGVAIAEGSNGKIEWARMSRERQLRLDAPKQKQEERNGLKSVEFRVLGYLILKQRVLRPCTLLAKLGSPRIPFNRGPDLAHDNPVPVQTCDQITLQLV